MRGDKPAPSYPIQPSQSIFGDTFYTSNSVAINSIFLFSLLLFLLINFHYSSRTSAITKIMEVPVYGRTCNFSYGLSLRDIGPLMPSTIARVRFEGDSPISSVLLNGTINFTINNWKKLPLFLIKPAVLAPERTNPNSSEWGTIFINNFIDFHDMYSYITLKRAGSNVRRVEFQFECPSYASARFSLHVRGIFSAFSIIYFVYFAFYAKYPSCIPSLLLSAFLILYDNPITFLAIFKGKLIPAQSDSIFSVLFTAFKLFYMLAQLSSIEGGLGFKKTILFILFSIAYILIFFEGFDTEYRNFIASPNDNQKQFYYLEGMAGIYVSSVLIQAVVAFSKIKKEMQQRFLAVVFGILSTQLPILLIFFFSDSSDGTKRKTFMACDNFFVFLMLLFNSPPPIERKLYQSIEDNNKVSSGDVFIVDRDEPRGGCTADNQMLAA